MWFRGATCTSNPTLILRKLLQNKINAGFDERSKVQKQETMAENRHDRYDTSGERVPGEESQGERVPGEESQGA